MFDTILIANRGEIACRVIATARRMGLKTVAVYSEADAGAPHVRAADDWAYIGPPPARESYLDAGKMLAAARETGAGAIHPGYGFLSENAEFAEACAAAGIVFIGPPPSAIRAMGLKDGAKALMEKAGVPVVPGYHGARQEADFLAAEAARIGLPVLIKAVAGGGGKGMKRVDRAEDFSEALESARREAQNAFGNAHVLVEKYVRGPRHIEMQVFADAQGNVVHLFERDCSLQRRHQKVIEEAPAPGMTAETRAAMGRAATEAARAVGYVGAGTVEFIADGAEGLRPDGFFFMEMNTRLQVEHPVTEAITGFDLVEWQIRVARGESLPARQDEIVARGHAVEARVYAEDPEHGFLPSIGRLHRLDLPKAKTFAFAVAGDDRGLRVDSGVSEGGEISAFYDPMIAKIIAHAPTREAALDRLSQALGATIVAGPRTNVAFLKALCDAPDFRAGRFDTGFIDAHLEALGATPQPVDRNAVAWAALEIWDDESREGESLEDTPWAPGDSFQLFGERRETLRLLADGEPVTTTLLLRGEGRERHFTGEDIDENSGLSIQHLAAHDGAIYVVRDGRQTRITKVDPLDVDLDAGADGDGIVKAPMHGKLVAVFVRPGEAVTRGQKLAALEAMKMEHALVAPRDGVVADILGTVGAQVAQGAKVATIHGG